MDLQNWYKKRGLRFILARAKRLNERYGLSSKKSIERIQHCVEALAEYGCKPTFAVPGIVVERNLSFIRRLQEMGVEIAVHGYNHIDMKAVPPDDGSRQLTRAAQLFHTSGLEVHGFRCPYLSATDDLIKVLPAGVFEYSSNKAIQWPVNGQTDRSESLLFDTIREFYLPSKSDSRPSIPWMQDGILEIPVSVPDDLQLHDGLGYGLEEITEVWFDILCKTYHRGELFNLMFHPELASFCEAPFLRVLQESLTYTPGIWVARLRDVSAWWKEKAGFQVETTENEDGSVIRFNSTDRATLLCRGFEPQAPSVDWDGTYRQLRTRYLPISGQTLPFIGVPPSTPPSVITHLRDMGYILEEGENAPRCNIYLDSVFLEGCRNSVELIDSIERTTVPLVRFWPWPEGFRSALCITGDLDALSFFDYAVRLIAR